MAQPLTAQADPDPLDWREWPEEKKRLLRARLLERRRRPWREVARPEQLPPVGEWYIWFLVGGRGAGKTRSGAEWLAEELQQDGPGDESAILAPTFGDARDRCVEGPSGLLRALGTSRAEVEAGRSWTVEKWNRSMGELRLRSGAVVHIDGADDGALRIQGGNFRRAWCDELRLWKQALQAWDESLLPAVRLGTPHIVVTSTPKPTRLVKRLLKDATIRKSHMTTYENAANLAPAFLEQMRSRYEGTRLGRQELHGALLKDVEGALWRADWIRVKAVDYPGDLYRAVVGMDPSDGLEDGDEQGLAVVGMGPERQLYVMESEGLREGPLAFCKRAVELAVKYRATVVVEKNHGGEYLKTVLELAMKELGVRAPYRMIAASQGKRTRAEPVAALYEQGGQVWHAGVFPELEEQLTTTEFKDGERSPDRLDALVWAVTEIMGYGLPVTEAEGGRVVAWSDARPKAGGRVVAWK